MWTVQADSQAEAEAEIADLCELKNLRPLAGGRASAFPGRPRWMARAEPNPSRAAATTVDAAHDTNA